MAAVTCPALVHYRLDDDCIENLAGVGSDVYVFQVGDLVSPLTFDHDTLSYSTPVFRAGKGLYKIGCADNAQSIVGRSLGFRKGFAQTFNFSIDGVSQNISKLAVALGALNLGIIVVDGDLSQIIYDPVRIVTFDPDGIRSETGSKRTDDRRTYFVARLQPVPYSNQYVIEPAGGWDSMLYDASEDIHNNHYLLSDGSHYLTIDGEYYTVRT